MFCDRLHGVGPHISATDCPKRCRLRHGDLEEQARHCHRLPFSAAYGHRMDSVDTGARFEAAIAEFLRGTRERSGLSQEALATQMGRDQPWVSKTEHGARRVQISELCAWLAAMGLTIADVAEDLDRLWSESFS